ncbi:MAG TPA: hypothetical protein DCG13_06080 [Legionellales bacterium]|nr:hypothetical protein [Legionellales bacterium]HCA88897.1 hypothetical protein [Legionellales bacterium]|tara:strand:+ start:4144 stop:6102 length:1959 start_codon:yes stop_codon:yes gene_type:complete
MMLDIRQPTLHKHITSSDDPVALLEYLQQQAIISFDNKATFKEFKKAYKEAANEYGKEQCLQTVLLSIQINTSLCITDSDNPVALLECLYEQAIISFDNKATFKEFKEAYKEAANESEKEQCLQEVLSNVQITTAEIIIRIAPSHAFSFIILQELIKQQNIIVECLLAPANLDYLNTTEDAQIQTSFQPLAYDLSIDEQTITLYSHAQISRQTIRGLAHKLDVRFEDASAFKLAQTIERINASFKLHVKLNLLPTLYSAAYLNHFENNLSVEDVYDIPFERVLYGDKSQDEGRGYPGTYQVRYRDNRHVGKIKPLKNAKNKSPTPLSKSMISPEARCFLNRLQASQGLSGDMGLEFLKQLEWLEANIALLKGKAVQRDVQEMYEELTKIWQKWSKTKDSIETLKGNIETVFNNLQPRLRQHHLTARFWGNVALAFLGLGVGYWIARLIHKKYTGHAAFFQNRYTLKTDQIMQTLAKMAEDNQALIFKVADDFIEEITALKEFIGALETKNSSKNQLILAGAKELNEALEEAHRDFIDNKITLSTFQNRCLEAIQTHRPNLEKYNKGQRIVANIALAVAGLGIGYAIAVLLHRVTSRHFTFCHNDVTKNIDRMEQTIQRLRANTMQKLMDDLPKPEQKQGQEQEQVENNVQCN